MSKVNFRATMSIDECKDLIKVTGDEITNIIVAEPGVGKSSILKMLESEMDNDEYDFIYVDCPLKDMMDIAASIPDHNSKTLEYYVSSILKLGNGKKKVIMLDEFMKAPKLMQVLFTRLMLERMWGDVPLPEGSFVFGTSNNASDGVGDAMLSHAGNRVCVVHMRKANSQEWNAWATANGVARSIRAWAAMNPKAFASYLDGDQEDNELIFNPSRKGQFVSLRSLTKCSVVVERKAQLTDNAVMCALAGLVGDPAARSMAAFIALESKLMNFNEVIKNPQGVPVPEDVSALVMMMFEAVDTVKTQDELVKYMEFINRVRQQEVQSIFFTMMMRTKPRLARYNESINKWAADNHFLM